eukprot:1725876-Amphidinium_carterae.1
MYTNTPVQLRCIHKPVGMKEAEDQFQRAKKLEDRSVTVCSVMLGGIRPSSRQVHYNGKPNAAFRKKVPYCLTMRDC